MFEAFNNYADFSEPASRSEFWLFQLLNMFVVLAATALIVTREGGTFVVGSAYSSSGC